MNRINRHSYFAQIAIATALRSTCPKAQVGAIVTIDNYIVSSGYNGSAIGMPHCTDVGCLLDTDGKCLRVVHAEANALISACINFRHGNAALYCTHFPCMECCKLIINAGIQEVYYIHEYLDPRWHIYLQDKKCQYHLLAFAGIHFEQIGEENNGNK